MLRVLPIDGVAWAGEHGVGAAAQRLRTAHRGVDAEFPRLVVGGRHDAAPVRGAADDERLRAQLRILELLDGGEERSEVEVGDDHCFVSLVTGQASTHSSSWMIGPSAPPGSRPSTCSSGPPIMKSVWMLEVLSAPAGNGSSGL